MGRGGGGRQQRQERMKERRSVLGCTTQKCKTEKDPKNRANRNHFFQGDTDNLSLVSEC